MKRGCLLVLFLFGIPCLLIFALIFSSQPRRFGLLPAYPGSTQITFNRLDDLNNSIVHKASSCSVDVVESFRVLVTKDSALQAHKFYLNSTNYLSLSKEDVEVTTPEYNELKNSVCYQGQGSTRDYPTAGVGILDPDDPLDAKIIAQYLPNLVPEMTIIIILQGHFSGD